MMILIQIPICGRTMTSLSACSMVSRAPNLQRVAAQLVALGEASPTGKRRRWSVDVDPLEM